MIVATVLRSGGIYTPEWVTRLKSAVDKHLPGVPFVCMTDMDVPGVACLPLSEGWPGWWSKINLFQPGLFAGDVVLFMDLDTLVVGDLGPLAAFTKPFAMIRDYHEPAFGQSCAMLWTPSPETDLIYQAFVPEASHIMRTRHSDQDWIWETKPRGSVLLQDEFPGFFGSYKADDLEEGPREFRVIAFHGKPKMHELGGWVADAWSP